MAAIRSAPATALVGIRFSWLRLIVWSRPDVKRGFYRGPEAECRCNFDRDTTPDRFLMEAFDEGATGAEVVNPYRNRQERASPATNGPSTLLCERLLSMSLDGFMPDWSGRVTGADLWNVMMLIGDDQWSPHMSR